MKGTIVVIVISLVYICRFMLVYPAKAVVKQKCPRKPGHLRALIIYYIQFLSRVIKLS